MRSLDLLVENYRDKQPLAAYFKLYSKHIGRLIASFFMFIVKASPQWALPVITAEIINCITTPGAANLQTIILYSAIGVALAAQNIVTHRVFVNLISVAIRDVERALRSALCERFQQLSIGYHKRAKIGGLQAKALRDVENIEMLTRMLFEQVPNVGMTLAIALIVTAIKAPHFLLFYLFTVPLAVVLNRRMKGSIVRANRDFRMALEDMSGKIVEMLRMIPVTRAHSAETSEMSVMNRKFDEVKESGLRLDGAQATFGAVNWATFRIFDVVTLAVAAYACYTQLLPIGVGDVVLLTTYFGTISAAVLSAMSLIPQTMKGLESIRSIGETLESPDIEENKGKVVVEKVKGAVDFSNVSYRYDDTDHSAVTHFSLSVKPGETIALVGPSGSGKSTIIQALIGFIRPTEGAVYIDGNDMQGLDLRSYRKCISFVSQETLLFDGTIRENIAYGNPDIEEALAMHAARMANLDDFIASLPEGINTRIYENGARLSGGQRQRIAIARALLRDPQILILDEATSALDVQTERSIQEALDRLIEGRTTFVVAHRLSTIQNATRIIVMDNGSIVETGTHTALMRKKGYYHRMYRLQMGEKKKG